MPNYVPTLSSDEVFISEDITQFLTPRLNTMSTSISALQTGKADTTHTHTGYATSDHTHDEYALSEHVHTGYAAADHTHDGYASATHTHAASDITGLPSSVDAYTKTESDVRYASASHIHTGYAEADHTHTGYASATHTHTAAEVGAATTNHTHSGYATTNHTHSGYASSSHSHTPASIGAASSSHTHSEYFATTGGTISGDTNIAGIVRVNGKQSIYDSGSMTTFGTNNQPTMIAGSQVYSKTAITVSSDRRLKRDIFETDSDELAKFVDKLSVVSYNYTDDDAGVKPRIGLIAQDVQEADGELAKFFVDECADGMLGLKPADLVFPLIAAVQRLSAEVAELKAAK